MEFEAKSTKETAQIAADFGSKLEPKKDGATVLGLYGELGAGKTTFMKFLAESFGIKETIQSPTFVIMKSFQLSARAFQTLIHIDAYRIEKEEEMINLGWRDIISDPKNLICVEWPEKIAGIMPPHIVIKFEHALGAGIAEDSERSEQASETERKITINNLSS